MGYQAQKASVCRCFLLSQEASIIAQIYFTYLSRKLVRCPIGVFPLGSDNGEPWRHLVLTLITIWAWLLLSWLNENRILGNDRMILAFMANENAELAVAAVHEDTSAIVCDLHTRSLLI